MKVNILGDRIYVENLPFFIQGMNLFLDPFRLETEPRKIYTPKIASVDLIKRIIPHLLDMNLNTVRIWPTIKDKQNLPAIETEGIYKLQDAGLKIIMNLPVNWNQFLNFSEIRHFITNYGDVVYDSIIMYCIANESYYGLTSPIEYLNLLNSYMKKIGNRPTLVTNANLVFPYFPNSDIIGADFFTYKYSISRKGNQDVGAVAKMFLEDAAKTFKYFPGIIFNMNDLVMIYYKKKALTQNLNYNYFYQNLMKVRKLAKRKNKPLLLAEYGYTEDPNLIFGLAPYMFIKDLCGHVWYNWINFDSEMKGEIDNVPLYEEFKRFCSELEKIKRIQYNL